MAEARTVEVKVTANVGEFIIAMDSATKAVKNLVAAMNEAAGAGVDRDDMQTAVDKAIVSSIKSGRIA